MPRPNRLSCPTSTKFFDVPGVPPPGPTLTSAGRAVTLPPGATAPSAPAAAPSRAVEVTKETSARRHLMIATSPCRTARPPHAKPAPPCRKAGQPRQGGDTGPHQRSLRSGGRAQCPDAVLPCQRDAGERRYVDTPE